MLRALHVDVEDVVRAGRGDVGGHAAVSNPRGLRHRIRIVN